MSPDTCTLPDGAELRFVRRSGDPRASPPRRRRVLVIPGLSDGAAPLWSPFGAALARREPPSALVGHDGILVSHRQPIGAPVLGTLADDLAYLLDALAVGPVVASGHSIGALVALRLAVDRPDLVEGVILTGIGLASSPAFDAHLDGFCDGPADRRGRHRALAAAARSYDNGPAARRLSVPALLVAGEADRLVSIESVHALRATFPPHVDASLRSFPGRGHDVLEHEPEAFGDACADFLSRLPTNDGRARPDAVGWSG